MRLTEVAAVADAPFVGEERGGREGLVSVEQGMIESSLNARPVSFGEPALVDGGQLGATSPLLFSLLCLRVDRGNRKK